MWNRFPKSSLRKELLQAQALAEIYKITSHPLICKYTFDTNKRSVTCSVIYWTIYLLPWRYAPTYVQCSALRWIQFDANSNSDSTGANYLRFRCRFYTDIACALPQRCTTCQNRNQITGILSYRGDLNRTSRLFGKWACAPSFWGGTKTELGRERGRNRAFVSRPRDLCLSIWLIGG